MGVISLSIYLSIYQTRINIISYTYRPETRTSFVDPTERPLVVLFCYLVAWLDRHTDSHHSAREK